MTAAVVAAGLVLLWLSVLVLRGETEKSTSYMLGTVIGFFALWPLIFIGLFSMGRRFRTPRTRAIILLSVWSVGIMGQLGNLQKVNARRLTQPAVRSVTTSPTSPATPRETSDDSTPSNPPANTASTVSDADAGSPLASLPVEYDYSRGSDERLTQLIEGAQQDRYRAIVEGYVRACAARPTDAVLALERVRFIERFLEAEDITMADAPKDHEAAVEYLTQNFAEHPATVLHQLERLYDDAFQDAVEQRAQQAAQWPVPEQAEFLLLRANRTDNPRKRELFARGSFDAHPTIAAGLLLLEAYKDPARRSERIKLLAHPVFDSADNWAKKSVMSALFETGQTKRAMAAYEELKLRAPGFVRTPETALQLAAAGEVTAARQILEAVPVTDWTAERVARIRFEFELEHGSADQAASAYATLRDLGIEADPLWRDRFALLLKHPGAGWQLRDLAGVFVLLCCGVVTLALPAILLVPVHYWSLLRARRSKPSAWPTAVWGLRAAWITFALVLLLTVLGAWYYQPEVLRSSFNAPKFGAAPVAHADAELIAQEGWALAGMAVVLAGALWRARAWRVLGAGEWSIGKVVGMSLAGAVALRILLLAYITVWPGAVSGGLASFSPMTLQLCLALLKQFGPGGLIVILAVAVPVLEELLFRGVLLQALARHIPFGWANALQAILFAALHENYRIFPFFVAFGMLGGALARRSGGLATSIAVHSLNNLTACFVIMSTHPLASG